MSRVGRPKAETLREASEAARKLRAALEGEGASKDVRAALEDRSLRIWIESWIMEPLDRLREEVEGR